MNQLIVSKKTGFKNTSLSTPIIIRDFRGKIFYSSEGLRLVEQFNLPEGQYLIDSGVFEQMKKPVIYKVPPLPPAERNFPLPENFLIEFAPNINKCTIMWDKKKIVFDNALKNLSLPELYFIGSKYISVVQHLFPFNFQFFNHCCCTPVIFDSKSS